LRRIAFDTETTGLDLRHGAAPFFVTTCDEHGVQRWWEWDVDPLTRQVQVPAEGLQQVLDLIESADQLVLHNAKFDATAMLAIAPDFEWPWHKTVDTLVAAHLLASNRPKDLTSLAMMYLSTDISKYEKAAVKAANEARSLARREHKDWMIAKEGLPCMPSAKTEVSRMDYWLPRALAGHLEYEKGHPWHTVLQDYANIDTVVTMRLWHVMDAEIKRRCQDKIFKVQNELTESIFEMERRGVTVSVPSLRSMRESRKKESELQGRRCRNIAKVHGYNLDLPKAGVNDSMRSFIFDVLKMPGIVNQKAKTDKPTLNSAALEKYAEDSSPRSTVGLFLRSLIKKRDVDTEVAFLDAYERFMLDERDGYATLHPNFNGCGTDTLRFSCQNPNGQNIKKPEEGEFSVRACFGPAPGREWVAKDAKNIELRIPAYASGEKDQIALFENPNDPPFYGSNHLLNFSAVYPDLWEKAVAEHGLGKAGPWCKKHLSSSWYQWCKNGAFAKQYGGGKRTVDKAFHRSGSYELLGNRFDKLEALNQRCINDAKTKGFIETVPDSSVDPERGYPLLCGRTESGGVLTTTPLNYFSSGSAMWWMRRAMARCHTQLKVWRKEGFDGFITLQVHDELIFDFPKTEVSPLDELDLPVGEKGKSNLWRMRVLKDLMEQGGRDMGIPLPVSINYHPNNWGEGFSIA